MKRLTAIFSLIFLLCTTVYAKTWIDDWFDNATATGSGPGMVKGSARNYYSAGYGSIRWQTAVDYPISIELPSVRFGCGGVDIFMGSMDLMNFDYLVSRMKTIMYSAGAFAFQYALSRLNPKANQIIQALDSAANFLNQLQLDECRAGKAVAAVLMSPFSPEAEADRGTIMASIGLSKGDNESWTEYIKKELGLSKAGDSKQLASDKIAQALEGCATELKQIANARYFLSYLADKGFIVSDFVPVVRGLIGDIHIDPNTGAFFLVEPCPQKVWGIVPAVVEGKIQQCDSISDTKCSCSDFTGGKSLTEKVRDYLVKYMNNLGNSKSPSSDTAAFVRAVTHYPVLNVLKMAYQTGVNASLITTDSNVVKCATEFYAAGLLANALSQAERLTKLITEWKAACSRSSDVGRCVYCKSDRFNELQKVVNTLVQRARDTLYRELDHSEIAKRSEACMSLERTMALVNRLNEIEQRYSLPVRLK